MFFIERILLNDFYQALFSNNKRIKQNYLNLLTFNNRSSFGFQTDITICPCHASQHAGVLQACAADVVTAVAIFRNAALEIGAPRLLFNAWLAIALRNDCA